MLFGLGRTFLLPQRAICYFVDKSVELNFMYEGIQKCEICERSCGCAWKSGQKLEIEGCGRVFIYSGH